MQTGALEFKQIYDEFQPRILRYLRYLIGEHDAEDLTQEVFVKVNQALPAFRGESQLSTWIYRITTNAAIDRMRTSSFRQDAYTTSLDDSQQPSDEEVWRSAEPPSVEQELMREERARCFEDFLKELPADYRTVFVLSELEEQTNHEIADILGLSLDTVKIRLHRARARLLAELRAHCKAEDWL